ncbi:type II toxin-antitoxin system RelE/ParE family toxin [Cupriavidus sp. WGlv3]|uniref:type II toxin-antitoxin system RelE family toxin n=1 Tax=Cupriavidus sp. WGlv3 TaxID=2919924 RepID=UPI002091056E|nr:type II toxin-antitoxin system RelE/ParE family toxin [Cupriavidus sp. WGlv3]MCO4864552.1 type II toxin-antitoxin system RelE/ParE family toxin [Cupriavidus sp. WGlv3]
MNSIFWTASASKQVRRLDKPVRVTIVDAVEALAYMPNCQHVKALVGHARVLFNWDGAIRIVEIQEVKRRDERTY